MPFIASDICLILVGTTFSHNFWVVRSCSQLFALAYNICIKISFLLMQVTTCNFQNLDDLYTTYYTTVFAPQPEMGVLTDPLEFFLEDSYNLQ